MAVTYESCECDTCGLVSVCYVTQTETSLTAVCSDCCRNEADMTGENDEEDFDCDDDEPRFADMDDGQPSEYDE